MRTSIIAVLCISIAMTAAVAGAQTDHDPIDEHTVIDLGAGYRWFGSTGSERAEEYEYQRDSWTLGGTAALIARPHRLFLDAEMKNNEDYFGDANYGFRDLILLRGVTRAGFHNLDNITLWNLDPSTGTSGVDVRDGDEKYGMQFSISSATLRLKTPNFPFHLYALGDLIQKDRTMQQRSLQGAGLFNNRVRTSQRRNIDWETKSYTVGANSHLGPVEIDISHTEKRFDASDDEVLNDFYAEAAAGTSPVRAAGTYPHNLVPETKGSASTVKIHTSHSGKIVAAASFAVKNRENESSGAEADVFVGNGAITWMPTPKIGLFLKYAHRDVDADNPGSVTIADVNDPSNTYGNSEVRPTVSPTSDTASVTGRFQLLPKTTLRAGYEYREQRRDDSEAWYLPDSTHRHTATGSVETRLIRTVNAKVQYMYRTISDPAYNTEADETHEGKATVSWSPVPQVIALGQYWIAKEDRDDLHYVDTGGSFEIPGDRDVTKDQILANLTVLLMDKLTVTGTYAYMHNKTEQPVVYASNVAPFERRIDDDVPYKATAFNYALDLNYAVTERLNIRGGVNHTLTRGLFAPDAADLVEPVDVSTFSRLRIRETIYSASGDYEVMEGLRVLVDYRYTSFNDVAENVYDDLNDSSIQVFWVGFSKRFG